MPCKIQIKQNITQEIESKTNAVLGKTLEKALELGAKINAQYGFKVVSFKRDQEDIDRTISVPEALVNIYYDNELTLEQQDENKPGEQLRLFHQLNVTPAIREEERNRFEVKGITLNQKSNIGIINKLIYRAITPATYDKTAIAKEALTSIVFGRTYKEFKGLVQDWVDKKIVPKWALELTETEYNKREDAWMLSNGLPQLHNTFKYVGRGFAENGKIVLDSTGEDIYDFNKPVFDDIDFDKAFNRQKRVIADKKNFVMGNFGISTGRDTTGYYIKYTDRWDLDLNNNFIQNIVDKTQTPFIVSGKLYKAGVFDEDGQFYHYYTHESDNADIDTYTVFMNRIESEEVVEEKKEEYTPQKASPKLISLMKEFIKSIGVDYKLVSNVVVNGKKVDSNGVALIMQKLIQMTEGKEDVALPEEAMHFVVEITKQTNPKLYQKLLKEINGHEVLNQVIIAYGNHPDYQKDGKRDYVKLKEEAIAQVLANRLEDVLGRTWWESIVDFFKGLFFSRSGFDKAAMDVLSGKIASVEDIDVSQSSAYFQLSEGERVFNNMVSMSNQIELKEDGLDDEGKPKSSYFLGELKAKYRVSDFVKIFYESIFKDPSNSEFQTALNDLKAEKGTAGHADIDHAVFVFVDPVTGLLRETPEDDSLYVSKLNPYDSRMYELLKNNVQERLHSFKPGTRFLTEIRVFDTKRSTAGTLDFVAITPEGKVNILDWKFIDLNVDQYEDIPWYKVKAWDIQMGKYKDMISSNYGVKNENFAQTRMIPILAKYTKADYEKEILPRLKEIRIGDVDVKNIEEDYLLPVGIIGEKTGNKRIDAFIDKLNNVYKKLSEEKVAESEKSAKAEQLNALYKAIRHLHIKGNIVPLINQAKILNKQVSLLLNKYKTEFEEKEKSEVSSDKINAFAGMLRIHLEALQPYLELKQLRFLLEEDTTENTRLKEELRKTLEKVDDYITDLKELDTEFGEKFNDTSSTPEKVVKGISKWFSGAATLQIQNIQTLYKLANKAFAIAGIETLDEITKLNTLQDAYKTWAKSKGLSIGDYFNILMKKDKNELINEFDEKFYKELKTNIKKKNSNWIQENINVSAYAEYIEQKKEEEISRILSRVKVGTKEEVEANIKREMAKVYNRYALDKKDSNGWLLYADIKQFPKRALWESNEWKELNKTENAPAKEFYNYIVERNKYYQEVGYLSGKAARKFLPWVRKGFIEGIVFSGKSRGFGEQFLRNISVAEDQVGFGQQDPISGEIINTVPKYFTRDIGEDYSSDLFKTMALYNEYAIKFKNLTDIEERSLQLLRAERNKKSIMTSKFGRLLYENGGLKYNPFNEENSQLLDEMIKGIVYQQKYLNSEMFDVALGKISGFGKNLNDKLGMKIFPENLEDRQLSLNKAITTLNTAFQLKTLGLNPLSALSNLFGGTVNGFINAGKYFTKLDFAKTQFWLLTNKAQGVFLGKKSLGDTPAKAFAALDYFLPFVENYNRDAAKKLSLNKLDEQALQDYLMFLMREGDEAVQTLNFFAFLKNAIVVDNEIINVREYLRSTDEYKDFYKGTQQERKARSEKFDKDVEDLIDSKGVLVLGEIKDGKFEIPGVEQTSESVILFRRLVQSFTSDALGSLSEENRRKINMNVYTASSMVFKNWIPRLVDMRIGDMKYNAASDAYEWGRMRTVFTLLTTDILKSIKSLKSAISGSDDLWIQQTRELYERKKQDYLDNTGKVLDMTESEFIMLVNQNIKNQSVDLIILLSMMSLLAGLKAMVPDDDEDPRVKNQWKFFMKATDKLTDELAYFYDPTSFFALVSQGIFPSLSLLETYASFLKHFGLENFGLIIGDEKIVDDAKPIKYLMKSFPISNQAIGYLPMFYPELAKDLGVKMQSTYNRR